MYEHTTSNHIKTLFQVSAKVKTWNFTKYMNFLYYAYGGICSPHPHNAINKAYGLVAAAPLTPSWPGLPPLVDIPIWDDDIYLKRRGADAFLAPGLPNQSHMLGTASSCCRCGPAFIHHPLPFPSARPQPSDVKNINFSIPAKLHIQQTAPDLPSQGCCGFSWCRPLP
jgi:hypothetical protein